MTTRDFEIIEFIEKYRVVSTQTLCHFFFKSIHSCYKVTHRLTEKGLLNRTKILNDSINSSYIYFINKPPQQIKHMLTITDFMSKWDSKYGVQDFNIQMKLGEIIPDAIMMSQNQLYIIEVEISNKGFNYMKYEKFFSSNEYLKFFNEMPTILVYGNANIPTNTRCNYRVIGIN